MHVLLELEYAAETSLQIHIPPPAVGLFDVTGHEVQVALDNITWFAIGHKHVLFAYHMKLVFAQMQTWPEEKF